MKKLLLTFATTLSLFAAHAAIVYTQPLAGGSPGYLSVRYTVGGSYLDEFVWDTFSVTTNVTLREIQWLGSGGSPADFDISINTIAFPGGTLWRANGSANETPTGTPGVFSYRFTLPAGFVLTGGQTYSLQIFATQNGWPVNWHWSAGTGGNGSHVAQVPAATGDYRFIATGGDLAFAMLNAATVPVTIAVNALPSAGGSVSGGGTFAPGTNVTVIATPAVGRTFLNWTEAGAFVSTNASYSFPADGNKTLSANFSGPNTGPYIIKATANLSIGGTVGGAGTYGAGETVTLDATPIDLYSLVSWTENGVVVSTNPTYSFISTQDRVIQANFCDPLATYFIYGGTPTPGGGITISGTSGLSSGTYYGGTIITFNATPYPGYHFVNWQQGAGSAGAQHVLGTNTSLIHVVVDYATIIATFAPNNPVLTLGVTPAASGTVSGAGTYASGASVTANAAPAVGYAFANWKSGGTLVSTNRGYTLTLTNHTTLTANFITTNRTITATAAPLAGGGVTGAGTYGNGASVTLTAIPATGYVFTNWTLGGAPAGRNNPVMFDALGNYAFVANFAVAPLPVVSPQLSFAPTSPGALILQWPTNATGFSLQQNSDLASTNWVTFAGTTTVVDTNYQASIPTQTGSGFFRLMHP